MEFDRHRASFENSIRKIRIKPGEIVIIQTGDSPKTTTPTPDKQRGSTPPRRDWEKIGRCTDHRRPRRRWRRGY